jgi:hypothetical protein
MGTFVVILIIVMALCLFMQIEMPFLIVGAALIATGVVILAGQIYGYLDLQVGKWEPKPLLGFVKGLYSEESSFYKWAEAPQSMKGLHDFMQAMPLSLSLIIVGFLCCWYYSRR